MKKIIKTIHGEAVVYDKATWRYRLDRPGPYTQSNWCVLTKDDTCGRGEYAEEIDVMADTKTHAKQVAEAVMAAEFVPELRVARIVYQGRTS